MVGGRNEAIFVEFNFAAVALPADPKMFEVVDSGSDKVGRRSSRYAYKQPELVIAQLDLKLKFSPACYVDHGQ